ncbi:uncharacterized protein LOC119630912 [Bombyx mori]|uniref:uncharacterized protein LOC119630912 n=1 Tax=Bombyx mori TaxID=7091 RepID=UPI002ED17A9E
MTTPGVPATQLALSQTSADIMAISLSTRIPEFWTEQPRAWYIRIESILAPQKLGDEVKFDIVVSKLPKEVIIQLTDFLAKPPDTGKFLALKTKLLSTFEESKSRQIERLIGEMELGDQKPSQLLHRMRELARDKVPDDTLRVLWQGHLPTTLRAILTVTETKDLDNLAMIADNVAEATRVNHISEVVNQQTSNMERPSTSDTSLILAEIAKLSVRMTNMEQSRSRQNYFDRNRDRSGSRSSSRRRTPQNPNWLCYYHYKFRQNAQKCVQPCAWKPSSEN